MSDSTAKRNRAKIFLESEEVGEGSSLSLRSYLSRRLQESPEQVPKPAPMQAASPQAAAGGQLLNSLDTDLAAGLEQYLPTPSIRLQVVKERLLGEIDELTEKLHKYANLESPCPETQAKIRALEERLLALKCREADINQQMAELFSPGSRLWGTLLFQSAATLFSIGKKALSPILPDENRFGAASHESFIRILHPDREKRDRMADLNRRLRELSEVYAEQIHRPRPAGGPVSTREIGDVLTRYDQTVRQLESLAAELRQDGSWWERMSRTLTEWIRKTYT